jgi:hypothetical protein
MIALTAISSVIILLLGLVRFVLFWEKMHHFCHANFVTLLPSMTGSQADVISVKVT